MSPKSSAPSRQSPFAEGHAQETEERPVGFPLVSLFILVALCGILMGMVVPLGARIQDGQVDLPDVFVSSVLASLVLSVIGMMVSLHVHRRLSGIVLGGAVGACLGIVAGPLCLVPRGSFSHLLVVGLAGAAALLGIAAASRLTARGSRVGASPVDDPDR